MTFPARVVAKPLFAGVRSARPRDSMDGRYLPSPRGKGRSACPSQWRVASHSPAWQTTPARQRRRDHPRSARTGQPARI
jgi:hypothetical protein